MNARPKKRSLSLLMVFIDGLPSVKISKILCGLLIANRIRPPTHDNYSTCRMSNVLHGISRFCNGRSPTAKPSFTTQLRVASWSWNLAQWPVKQSLFEAVCCKEAVCSCVLHLVRFACGIRKQFCGMEVCLGVFCSMGGVWKLCGI